MSKILLIEPYKILRQAISLSLLPEHEVEVDEGLSSRHVGSLDDYDLLIVDAAALREKGRLTTEVTGSIQACQAAILWLEDDESSEAPKRDKLVRIQKPIEKGAFQAALSDLLSSGAASRPPTAPATQGPKAGTGKKTTDKKSAEVSDQTAFEFIDLVEVVPEESNPEHANKPAGKSGQSK
jgi:hypothetical protein